MKVLLKKDYFLYFFTYFVSYALVLLTRGVFWDDWVIFHVSPEARMNVYLESGRPLYAIFFNVLFSLDPNGLFLPSALTFLSYFSAMLILDGLLSQIQPISSTARLMIVLFFGLFPVNFSRISAIILSYSVCFCLFFIAFHLTSLYLKNRNILLRIGALGLFYLSFLMESLLMFFILVLMFIAYKEKERIRNLRDFFGLIFKYFDFLVLPVVYFLVKISFFKPFGKYSDYNTVNLQGLKNSFLLIPDAIQASFISPLLECLELAKENPYLIFISSIFIFFILKKFFVHKIENKSPKKSFIFSIFGIFIFIVAVFPYLVVGTVPVSLDWGSRHQILVPLGTAFFLFYFSDFALALVGKIPYTAKKNLYLRLVFYSLIISTFVGANFTNYLDFQKDWFKQLSLVENFKSDQIIETSSTFFFVDNTLDLNAQHRTYRFYEFTGLMKFAFGNETRYGASDKNTSFKELESYIPFSQYNMSQYVITPYQYTVTIEHGSYILTTLNTIKLIYYRLFDPNEFLTRIKKIVVLSSKPIA